MSIEDKLKSCKIIIGSFIDGAAYCYDIFHNVTGFIIEGDDVFYINYQYKYLESLAELCVKYRIDAELVGLDESIIESFERYSAERAIAIKEYREKKERNNKLVDAASNFSKRKYSKHKKKKKKEDDKENVTKQWYK